MSNEGTGHLHDERRIMPIPLDMYTKLFDKRCAVCISILVVNSSPVYSDK